ncbi:peptidoglycan-binding domain-containing protein [Cryptosporangium phraense]|uniref:Peptidoglycan-binding protein n=1 Tax=Cryptosporangium phraense TaxID=2593070 RepID=A0A545AXN7_9ACTN|nr:peptidoglycan-binding domain-containing protein [Cryptosporangium phraense]TQS46096.1 peptidoglycan-binding protein [Cryptosporangium phraense]
MTLRKPIALAVSALALGAGLALAPATTASAAYQCDMVESANGTVYAGYYTGNTIQPSSTGVSDAGIEAQCILRYKGFNPGTIDGVFGSNSRAAALAFQKKMNRDHHAGLTEDGKVGKNTWPWLRNSSYY